MEEIVSIHSIVHKKQKNIVKTNKIQSIPQSSSKKIKEIAKHSSTNVLIGDKIINNINQDITSSIRKNLSQEKLRKSISFIKKYDFNDISESLFFKKNMNSKIHSEKDLKNEEESNTPLMNLQRNKKPNYLMKSAFIKDKSLTPQEKSYQNISCPIYDFYNVNSGFNTTKNDNLIQNTSFTQYYNNFKKVNNPQVNEHFNRSPNTNLSDKNNMNFYYNYPFITHKQSDKINEIDQDHSSSLDEQDKNNQIYNSEKDDNLVDLKSEVQNVEGNTPSNLGGGAFSPSFDFFDESIFGNDNNFHKSPINYKQMNVNININNNSQNNNIYYHMPNIINNFNNNSNSNYYNNNINSKDINNNINNNGIKQQNIENIKNNLQNNLNNNQINLGNIQNLNRGYNNNQNNIQNNIQNNMHNNIQNNLQNNIQNNIQNNMHNIQNNIQNNLQNQIKYNKQVEHQNFTSIYNNLNIGQNQNQLDNRPNQMQHFTTINQNIANYLNQISTINNNMNIKGILNQNFKNNNINYNINYNNNNNNQINNNNINFSSIANAYMNQNLINQNLYNNINNNNINNPIQLQIPIQNNNPELNNQGLQYYIYNPEKMGYQNNNILNLSNQLNNNYSYMNNINSFNQNNIGIINNQMNNNLSQANNNQISESIFYSLSPMQLAQQCHIIAKNQTGCRYLQNYIASNPELFRNIFFPCILDHIKELSNDQFANYFIKKIFQYLNEDMLLKLIQTMLPIVEQIGTNQYGTRVLQDLIDFLNSEKTFLAFVNIIIPHIKLLIIDLNGSHIIYKLIVTKNKSIKIIEEIICMQVKDIAITRKGCSFLKKYFDFQDEKELIKIKQCILQNLTEIITDQYGNYVIQSILVNQDSPIVKDFINEIIKNLVFYSNNKFSSNAVEKCFQNESMKNIVLDQFLQKDIFEKIIMDKFGNYVVQKAIYYADNNRKNYMFQLLIPLIPKLKSQYFGQRLLSKLISQYPNLNNIL